MSKMLILEINGGIIRAVLIKFDESITAIYDKLFINDNLNKKDLIYDFNFYWLKDLKTKLSLENFAFNKDNVFIFYENKTNFLNFIKEIFENNLLTDLKKTKKTNIENAIFNKFQYCNFN